jgi:hypothetical protein
MRVLLIALVLAFTAAPAYAQKKTDEQKEQDAKRQAEADRAYKSSLQRIPPKAANIDPWSDVKGNSTPDPNVSSQTRAKKTPAQ